jgi:hypothetical protein
MLAAAQIGVRDRVCIKRPRRRVAANCLRIRRVFPTFGVKSVGLFPTLVRVRHKDTSPAMHCLVRAIAQDATHSPRGYQPTNQQER